jgi:hypothetical protein
MMEALRSVVSRRIDLLSSIRLPIAMRYRFLGSYNVVSIVAGRTSIGGMGGKTSCERGFGALTGWTTWLGFVTPVWSRKAGPGLITSGWLPATQRPGSDKVDGCTQASIGPSEIQGLGDRALTGCIFTEELSLLHPVVGVRGGMPSILEASK